MSKSVEERAMVVVAVAGAVLFLAHAIDRDWPRAVVFAVGAALVAGALVRRRRQSASAPPDVA